MLGNILFFLNLFILISLNLELNNVLDFLVKSLYDK